MKRENLIGLDVDHRQICDMKSTYSGISAVAAFIDKTLVATQTQNGCSSEGMESKISVPNILTTLDTLNYSPPYSPRPTSFLNVRSGTFRTIGGESNRGSFGNIPFFADAPSDREDPHLPCHLIPLARNKGFFGRKDILEDLENNLLPAKRGDDYQSEPVALKSFAICGPGGMRTSYQLSASQTPVNFSFD